MKNIISKLATIKEVIQNKAAEILSYKPGYKFIYPNDYVKRLHSSNYTSPTAVMHIAAATEINSRLLPKFKNLHSSLNVKQTWYRCYRSAPLSIAPQPLYFDVRRREPELIRPAKQTPHELKKLSDLDSHEGSRYHVPLIQFYKHDKSMQGKDPVKVIRKAIAQALVYYYPFAGRLREVEEKKLVVDCTGEGVMFIEADADISLEQFGDALYPPFPCLEDLLFDVPVSRGILNSPPLLIQVTRLKCGSFIFALRLNHVMADGVGIALFMKAVGEMARGAASPSTLPVWDRHLLSARVSPQVIARVSPQVIARVSPQDIARVSPQVISDHRKDDETEKTITHFDDKARHSFFFGSAEISAIRKHVPPQLRSCSAFEALTACIWRCYTRAVNPDPTEEVHMGFTVNVRSKFDPPLPAGYYGNAFAISAATTTAGKLCGNPLGFALELIQKSKAKVTEEYVRSVLDTLKVNSRSDFSMVRRYVVSDVTRSGFRDVDFGWGKAVYGGPALGGKDGVASYCISFRNHEGEEGIVVPICLSPAVMETFVEALNDILNGKEIEK